MNTSNKKPNIKTERRFESDLPQNYTQIQTEIEDLLAAKAECHQCQAIHYTQILMEKNALMEAIVENSNDMMLAVDKNFTLLLVNKSYQNYFYENYHIQVEVGKNLFSFSHQNSRSAYWRPYYERALQGEVFSLIDKVIDKNGYLQTFEVRFNPILMAQNGTQEVAGVSVVIRDLSELIAQQRQLADNQNLLTSISQNIREGIYRSSPKFGVYYANQTFLEMFGYDSLEDLRKNSASGLYFLPEERERIVKKLVENTIFTNVEVHFRRKDGSHFWGELSGMTSKDTEGNIWFDGAIRDITERKKSEEILHLQNEELRKVNQELDRFVYSASHDLRAPLMSILGILELIRLDSDLSAKPNERAYLEMIEKSVKKLDHLTREITHYSRNTRLEIRIERFCLVKLIGEVFEELAYLPQSPFIEKSVEIVDAPQAADFWVCSDSNRLHKILVNLISNAIHYHDLNKEKPYIKIRLQKTTQSFLIEIQDNGRGIEPALQQQVFEMFYRASQDSQGSGLGLYIVKETIEKLKGKITLQSDINIGATFTLELPQMPLLGD
ncbi:sensor histidine kinase [Hugenholtzia roseola]|uniref:sensor histidine kinase n=1 Tax=Hugenholtzia roseola TaxID=1002 RepID=UPI00042110F9|nr:PAS domain-containing sensor histidine kinase [Hugenholtzia roseola]